MSHLIRNSFATGTLVLLASCGGGGSSSTTSGSSILVTDAYPVGVAVASPSTVVSSSSTIVAKLDLPWRQRLGDWWLHLQQAVQQKSATELARVLLPLMPMGTAQATPSKIPEGLNTSNYIRQVLTGAATPDSTTLPLNGFFKSQVPANCYGPQVLYALHDDSSATPKASGTLPGGDVGMWLDRNENQTTGTPCAAAQLSALIDPIKSRANAGLMLGARMVAMATTGAGAGLPSSGSSDVTAAFQSFMTGMMPAGATATVSQAQITNNGSDSFTYQWRVQFTRDTRNMLLVVKLTHQKTSAGFTGLMQYGVSDLRTNAQSTAQCDTSKTLAVAGTVRYSKTAADALAFSAREAPYCVSGADAIVTNFGSWTSLDSNNELDPTKTTGAHATGWHQDGGGFKRFAANFDPASGAGNYLFAWQAGIQDSNARMFAVNTTYNGSSEQRDMKAFFGFSPNMGTTSNAQQMGALICNWAGPGLNHSPTHSLFQSQTLTLPASATDWNFPTNASTNSKIHFAPTNTCSSTAGMTFDVDANNSIASGEGASTSNSGLDSATGSNTVYQEITSRGFVAPSMF